MTVQPSNLTKFPCSIFVSNSTSLLNSSLKDESCSYPEIIVRRWHPSNMNRCRFLIKCLVVVYKSEVKKHIAWQQNYNTKITESAQASWSQLKHIVFWKQVCYPSLHRPINKIQYSIKCKVRLLEITQLIYLNKI